LRVALDSPMFVAAAVVVSYGFTKAHAAPVPLLSRQAPTSPVAPSAESSPFVPYSLSPSHSLGISFGPCWSQVDPERVNSHAAPLVLSSARPPTRAVSPSAERATLTPNLPSPVSPPPVSFGPCCVQVAPERVKIQPGPWLCSSSQARISAVSPLAERATSVPNLPLPVSSSGVSVGPFWVPVEPERVKT